LLNFLRIQHTNLRRQLLGVERHGAGWMASGLPRASSERVP
jgi:hypothetical protein